MHVIMSQCVCMHVCVCVRACVRVIPFINTHMREKNRHQAVHVMSQWSLYKYKVCLLKFNCPNKMYYYIN